MKVVNINERVLKRNEQMAAEIRTLLKEKNVFLVNLRGSPGAGKTTILEKVIAELKGRKRIAVIEGDLYTTRDAERLEKYGVQVVQVNTGGICHLEADMVKQALSKINLEIIDLLVIENVGNLVCTADYDLGEEIGIIVLSVSEGSDKIMKYPLIFQSSEIMLINKLDMLKNTDFSTVEIKEDLKRLNREMVVFNLSCKTGEGIFEFSRCLEERIDEFQATAD